MDVGSIHITPTINKVFHKFQVGLHHVCCFRITCQQQLVDQVTGRHIGYVEMGPRIPKLALCTFFEDSNFTMMFPILDLGPEDSEIGLLYIFRGLQLYDDVSNFRACRLLTDTHCRRRRQVCFLSQCPSQAGHGVQETDRRAIRHA